jgi:hypothetical protein
MVAPYRSRSAPDDGASEAREIEAFARAMHAERRVWGNEDLGHAISCAMLCACVVFLGLHGARSLMIMTPMYLALIVFHVRRWRAAVALARAERAARMAPASISPAA